MSWSEFEDRAHKPAEKLALAIVRELDRSTADAPHANLDPDARLIHAFVQDHAALFETHWRTYQKGTITRSQILTCVDKPDVQIAGSFLAEIKKQRGFAADRGELDPNDAPAWIEARQALYLACQREGYMPFAELNAAARAATKAVWVAVRTGETLIGYVERKRVVEELRVTRGKSPQWRVVGDRWVVQWAGGRGRLRIRLSPTRTGTYAHSQAPYVVLDTTELQAKASAPQSMQGEGQPAAPVAAPQPARRRAMETQMAKKNTDKATEATESKATETKATEGALDVFAECDKRALNLSAFGVNGRKEALVILYTRSKPSTKVAQAKGKDLASAFEAAIEQADGAKPATNAKPGKPAESETESEAAADGGEMF